MEWTGLVNDTPFLYGMDLLVPRLDALFTFLWLVDR
jgi:hypothetical protein